MVSFIRAQVLRFTPALTVTEDEIEECARKVGEALQIVAAASLGSGSEEKRE